MDSVAFLESLLSIPSPSGEEDAVAEFLVEEMAALGFQASRDEAGNALGSLGEADAGRTIVLLGHMDTVPGDIAVRREGRLLYGRGAVDAKGPLATSVLAAARVAPEKKGVRIQVIGAVEEESHATGARYLARTMPPPYCAIIGEPSAWDAITLGYKGILSLDYRLVQQAGHSAGYATGPAEKAVAFWNHLADYAAAYNEGRSGRFQTLDPALRSMHTFGDGLQDGVDAEIGVRLPPGIDVPGLKEQIQSWSDGARVTFQAGDPAVLAAKNTPLVRALLSAVRAGGGRPRFKVKTGTSDMNVVGPAWDCPMVAYGPGDSSLDHTPDEHIDVDEFLRAVDVLTRALETLIDTVVSAEGAFQI